MAVAAPAAHADQRTEVCSFEQDTPSGVISIAPLSPRDGETLLELNLAPEAPMVGADGSRASIAFFGLMSSPLTVEAIPGVLDNLMVTLNFGDASRADGPTIVYYTRNNTIPLDIAPAKLWYPQYRTQTGQFGILVSLGDLERQMQFGPGDEPVSVLSWIAKRIGTKPDDEDVIDSGEIPLAPIRAARDDIEAALRQLVAAQSSSTC